MACGKWSCALPRDMVGKFGHHLCTTHFEWAAWCVCARAVPVGSAQSSDLKRLSTVVLDERCVL